MQQSPAAVQAYGIHTLEKVQEAAVVLGSDGEVGADVHTIDEIDKITQEDFADLLLLCEIAPLESPLADTALRAALRRTGHGSLGEHQPRKRTSHIVHGP